MQNVNHYQKKSNSFVNIDSKNHRPQANPPQVELLRNSQPIQFYSLFQKEKKPMGLSLVSPNSSELNKFKQKLSRYLQQRQKNSFNSLKKSAHSQNVNKSEVLHSKEDDKAVRPSQDYSKSHKSSSISLSRRKNIKQCIQQWSSSKHKQKSEDKLSRTLENDDEIDQPRNSNHTGSLIVVKKINRQREKSILTKKEQLQYDFYNFKEVPIHHTQLFFFRKHKKAKTEHSQTPVEESNAEPQLPKARVSMQQLLQIRKSIRHNPLVQDEGSQLQRLQTPMKPVAVEDQEIQDRKMMMIHQQELFIRKGKSSNLLERNKNHFGKNKKRNSLNSVQGEAVEISPWQRRNTTDLSLLF